MIQSFLRKHTSRGLYSAIGQLYSEIKVVLKHRRGTMKAKRLQTKQHLKLNIGCGSKLKEGWINIDLSPKADLTLDAREPFPLPDRSCSLIYSEHFLEHLDYPGPATGFLGECYRMLEAGGTFSVGVPDTEWPLAEYAGTRSEGYFGFVKSHWHPSWCRTEMEHINYHFRQGTEHRFAYDYATLAQALGEAGFQQVRRRSFDPALDSPDRERGTLYVDACKPGDT